MNANSNGILNKPIRWVALIDSCSAHESVVNNELLGIMWRVVWLELSVVNGHHCFLLFLPLLFFSRLPSSSLRKGDFRNPDWNESSRSREQNHREDSNACSQKSPNSIVISAEQHYLHGASTLAARFIFRHPQSLDRGVSQRTWLPVCVCGLFPRIHEMSTCYRRLL